MRYFHMVRRVWVTTVARKRSSSIRYKEESAHRPRPSVSPGQAERIGAEALEQAAQAIRADDVARIPGGEVVDPERDTGRHELDHEHRHRGARTPRHEVERAAPCDRFLQP